MLESGMLWGQEAEFLKVLHRAGLDAYFEDPRAPRPGVTPVFVRVTNPIAAWSVPADLMERLAELAPADQEIDNTLSLIRSDMADPKSEPVWATDVPAAVVRAAKELGYDGILDRGGKHGGDLHNVWIAFDPSQVVSAIALPGVHIDLARLENVRRSERVDAALNVDPKSQRSRRSR
jgi:hypothetical protein